MAIAPQSRATRRHVLGAGLAFALMTVPAAAQEKPKLKAVATISILGDLVEKRRW